MRIFVYEHVTGGGSIGMPIPASLAREGRAMLAALASDIASIPGVSAAVILDGRIEPIPPAPGLEVHRVSELAEAERLFGELAFACDGTLVIAPELDGTLASIVRAVSAAGGRHLGSAPESIELASDKLLLPRILEAAGVPSIPSEPWPSHGRTPFARPAVVKPRRGAGSRDVYLLDGEGSVPPLAPKRESVITPFVPGLPASVIVLAGERRRIALRASRQELAPGTFEYLGGSLPLERELEGRARDLALRAVDVIPGLRGFIGVDMILDGSRRRNPRDHVVEVNARPTTSYVGLRAHSLTNLAGVWLELLRTPPQGARKGVNPPPQAAPSGGEQGGEWPSKGVNVARIPEILWRAGETRFGAGGAERSPGVLRQRAPEEAC